MSINTKPGTHSVTGIGSTAEVNLGYKDRNAGFRGVLTSGSATYDIEGKLSKHGDFSPIDSDTTDLTATSDKFTNDGNFSAIRITITAGTGTVFLDLTTGD